MIKLSEPYQGVYRNLRTIFAGSPEKGEVAVFSLYLLAFQEDMTKAALNPDFTNSRILRKLRRLWGSKC